MPFLAALDELGQLFCALDALYHLHDLDLALLHFLDVVTGQLGLILQAQGEFLSTGGLLFTHAVVLHMIFSL